jgi:hypothetical protein
MRCKKGRAASTSECRAALGPWRDNDFNPLSVKARNFDLGAEVSIHKINGRDLVKIVPIALEMRMA